MRLSDQKSSNTILNILYTSTSYPPAIGGAQLHTHQIARELAQHDSVRAIAQWTEHRTDWLLGTTLNAPRQTQQYVLDGVPVETITLSSAERARLAPYVLGYYIWKRVAIDHISDVLVPKLEAAAGPVDLIHNARVGRESFSYASLKLARRKDVPFVFVPYHHPRWVGWNYREYIALYREADRVITLTNVEKETLMRLSVREERIAVTGIGPIVDTRATDEAVRRAHSMGDAPLVLFLGQKYPYKGVAALLSAAPLVWSRFPETRFAFVGPDTRFSERLLADNHDPRILNIPGLGREEKSQWLAACAVMCMPSAQESFGIVYVEAWMMGKPVIGGDIPPLREVIAEGEDGYLVPQEATLIAERICHLLDHPTLAAQMGERGRQKVLERYTWDKLAQKTRSIYESALA